MQIICTSAARFYNPANKIKEINKQGDEVLVTSRSLDNSVVITPSQRPQVVPDWIKGDPLFALMVKAGSVIQVQVLSDAPEPSSAATAPAKTGWGVQQPNIGLGFNTSDAKPAK